MTAVLAEQIDGAVELDALLLGKGVLDELRVFQIALHEGVEKQRALVVGRDEAIDVGLQTGRISPDRPGDLLTGADRDIGVHNDVREHLSPEFGQVAVGDGDPDEPGVDHLEEVFGLQVLARRGR